ncbi:hypothetical protein JW992_13285 [candidate division KSB1 bacterium]|nr:hypothetical protein [candidate division KSB1 bacterium]
MKHLIIIAHLMLVGFSSLTAQSQQEQRAQEILQRLEQQIRTADNLLRTFPDPAARDLLGQAIRLRDEGIEHMHARRWRQAESQFRAALQLADRAIARLSEAPMQRAKQDAENWLQRAERVVPQSGDQEANRLYRQALSNHQTAEMHRQRGDLRRALEYYRIAGFMAEQAYRRIDDSDPSQNMRMVSETERFENLLQRAHQSIEICNNVQAKKLVLQAASQRSAIEHAILQNNTELALSLYANATRLLLRAIDLCEGKEVALYQQAVEEAEWLDRLIDGFERERTASEGIQTQFIKDRLLRLQRQIHHSLSQGNYQRALQEGSVARTLALRLHSPARRMDYRQRAEIEIQRLETELQRWNGQRNTLTVRQRAVLHAAEKNLRGAENHLQKSRLVQAMQSILAANRFLSILEMPRAEAHNREQLQNRMEQLQAAIDRTDSARVRDPELLRAATEMLREAQSSFEEKNYDLTAVYLQLTNDLFKMVD